MKILIPYDGTKNADLALDTLQRTEFAHEKHEILVVVTDVWLHETIEEFFSTRARRKRQVEISDISSYAPALRAREEERFLIGEVIRRLESKAALWKVRVETLSGSNLVSSEVLEIADRWGAELVILGSQNGGGAKRVAAEAKCPVRVSRAPVNFLPESQQEATKLSTLEALTKT